MTLTAPEAVSEAPESVPTAGDVGRTGEEIDLDRASARIEVRRYTDPDHLAREFASMWSRVWQIACREIEIPDPGDYLEYRVGHRSFLVLRGDDGVIRAFHNVCPHRANILREGCGNTGDSLTCPFHYLRFDLAGKLAHLTDPESWRHHVEGELDLRPVAVDQWGGWVFINPQPEPVESLREFLGPVYDQLAPYHLEQTVAVGMNATTSISANWKVAIEAFIENYHVQGVHPQLLPMLDDVNTRYALLGKHSLMVMPFGVASPRLGDAVDPMEILEAFFGESAQATDDESVLDTNAASELILRTDANPMAPFAAYMDENGEMHLPEGLTVRDILKPFLRQIAESKGVDFSALTDDQMVDDWHYFIFPNIILNVMPTGTHYIRFLPDATDPSRTIWDVQALDWVPDREQAKALRAPHVRFDEMEQSLGELLDQDAVQMPRTQRGLMTGALDHVTVSSQEIRLVHVMDVLDSYLDG